MRDPPINQVPREAAECVIAYRGQVCHAFSSTAALPATGARFLAGIARPAAVCLSAP